MKSTLLRLSLFVLACYGLVFYLTRSPYSPPSSPPGRPQPTSPPVVSQPPAAPASADAQKVSYSVVRIRGKVRVVVVPSPYRNLKSMRLVGEKLRDDLGRETIAIAVVFDSSKAAGMYDAMLDSPSSSLGAEKDRFYDRHLIGTYNKNSNTGLHRFQISLQGLDGPSTEVTY